MPLAVPENQFENVERYLRQRRAAGRPVTQRDYRAAWDQYWGAKMDRQLQAQQMGLQKRRTDLLEKEFELQEQTATTSGYFEALGTLFQGIFLAGFGKQRGWWG